MPGDNTSDRPKGRSVGRPRGRFRRWRRKTYSRSWLFPMSLRQLHSTNPLERLKREIGPRTGVVGPEPGLAHSLGRRGPPVTWLEAPPRGARNRNSRPLAAHDDQRIAVPESSRSRELKLQFTAGFVQKSRNNYCRRFPNAQNPFFLP